MASHSPGEMLGLMTTADNHPPLFYLLLSLVMSIFGDSVWALRLLSVFGAIGLVSLGAGPVRRTFGNRTAFIYAGGVLFTPVVLIYAHEPECTAWRAFASPPALCTDIWRSNTTAEGIGLHLVWHPWQQPTCTTMD